MNKRYMDFVPSKGQKNAVHATRRVKTTTHSSVVREVPERAEKSEIPERPVPKSPQARRSPARPVSRPRPTVRSASRPTPVSPRPSRPVRPVHPSRPSRPIRPVPMPKIETPHETDFDPSLEPNPEPILDTNLDTNFEADFGADSLEENISDFTDMERLAAEIAEVTQADSGPSLDFELDSTPDFISGSSRILESGAPEADIVEPKRPQQNPFIAPEPKSPSPNATKTATYGIELDEIDAKFEALGPDAADTIVTDIAAEEVVIETEASDDQAFSLKQEPRFGVIESYQPKFVKTEVEKRPLSSSQTTPDESEAIEESPLDPASQEALKQAKSIKKIKVNGVNNKPNTKTPHPNSSHPSKPTRPTPVNSQMRIPQARFINQNKVAKRPLSKNVYPQASAKAIHTNSNANSPVKIVSKPKKSGKIGTILAVIGTIVLGAIVGTVAFLVLPR